MPQSGLWNLRLPLRLRYPSHLPGPKPVPGTYGLNLSENHQVNAPVNIPRHFWRPRAFPTVSLSRGDLRPSWEAACPGARGPSLEGRRVTGVSPETSLTVQPGMLGADLTGGRKRVVLGRTTCQVACHRAEGPRRRTAHWGQGVPGQLEGAWSFLRKAAWELQPGRRGL